ncbi:hypothetical protein CAPTEDRAFT_189720 [Capitella teleta]|uniref:EF-hand domain-containing protein n=1 Tax=Capitella teleta TaxID=283909 RepID=R7VGL8_CAPTE|nr:hypothetical protein CAPTEDRAFT_189720 [Capitella teleta]|eukprot:ELU17744.1 hypothetical protein CAPTEDRAFT_189720 [Capitella teleta]
MLRAYSYKPLYLDSPLGTVSSDTIILYNATSLRNIENGFIEGKELDAFLREFVGSVNTSDVGPEVISETAFESMKTAFMDAFDENEDQKIDIAELAQILPTEETFLLLFRRDNPLDSSVEFMRVWRHYDKDCSGYIECDELKDFLSFLLREAKQDVCEEKLLEYTDTMLQLFDRNKDGKLQLSEMAKLLPVRENFLCRPIFRGAAKITRRDIDRVFNLYDRDKNGTIENEELNGFLKDLMELVQQDYDTEDIDFMKMTILDKWDLNNDGKINKSELSMLLLQQSMMCQMSVEDEE